MGILSWFTGGNTTTKKEEPTKTDPKPEAVEVPGLNGAVEVRRPDRPVADVSVFEFGSVAASADKVTLAGYCPVSDDLEPCRWEILPASGSDAPQFRVVFWVVKGEMTWEEGRTSLFCCSISVLVFPPFSCRIYLISLCFYFLYCWMKVHSHVIIQLKFVWFDDAMWYVLGTIDVVLVWILKNIWIEEVEDKKLFLLNLSLSVSELMELNEELQGSRMRLVSWYP